MSLDRRLLDGPFPDDGVVLVADGHRWTRAALRDRVARAVGWWRAQGVGRGDHVVLQGPKHPDWLVLHLGLLRLGAATAPVNPRAPAPELTRWVDALSPGITVVAEASSPVPGIPFTDAASALDHQAADDTRLSTEDDLALIGSTSGTTGAPKPVPLRHRHLLATLDGLAERWRLGTDDVLLHVLPLFHIHGLVVAQHLMLATGGRTVWRPRFDVDDTLDAMRTHDVTVFMGVPTLYHRLVAHPDLQVPDSLRLCTSGSAPLSMADAEAFTRRTGRPIVQRYGMTEIGIVLGDDPAAPAPGTVGRALSGATVEVVDADDQPVPPGRTGEIRVRGPGVFDGYLDRPDATAEALRDGWMYTGDLATLDEAGRVTIRGRRSALVLCGGFNVYPGEVEAVLQDLDGVREAALVGLPDDDLGEVPVATVVGDGLDPDALRAACRQALAAYKVPRLVAVADALPRNAMGKLQRGVLSRWWSTPTCREARPDEAGRLAAWNIRMARETEGLALDPEVALRGVEQGMARQEARYLVATLGGGLPVGQLMITTEWSDWRARQVWWIQSVYVPPDWRRRGVLRALFDAVNRMAQAEGAAGLRLYVDQRNTTAQRAYERLGWTSDHYRLFERMD